MAKVLLPLQEEYQKAKPLADHSIPATHPEIGYRQLQPNGYSGLMILTNETKVHGRLVKTDPDLQLWEGDKIYFVCKNDSLGVEKGASPVVAFKCRTDGTFGVPENLTWPECDVRTTTAKPPIVDAVWRSMRYSDSALAKFMIDKEMMASNNINDEDLLSTVMLPAFFLMAFALLACLFFTRHDSLCCQVCNRDYEVKQMQNFGHSSYHYSESG